MMYHWILLSLAYFLTAEAISCPKLNDPEESSYACLCNATYCDELDHKPEELLKHNAFLVYESSRDGGRLEVYRGKFFKKNVPELEDPVIITVDITEKYQEIFGFGGAMTDSAGLNIASLSEDLQRIFMKQYFGKNGIGYSFIRVPFGGTDFSTHKYSYDDTKDDKDLEHFALAKEDLQYKIPYIKMAKQLSPVPIKLFSSSWSAPEWMKECRNGTKGFNRLKKEYYQLYSDYYIKCLDAYKNNGLHFWGITPQNEPHVGLEVNYGFNSMGFTTEEMREFIGDAFGPTLHSRGYGKLKLMILDDNRKYLPDWAEEVMEDDEVKKYVSGIAIHWYFDFREPDGDKLIETHNMFPDKFLLYTESSVIPIFDSTIPNPPAIRLGNWERAENYTSNIIQDLNNWVTGWVDWNLALDKEGGPNWAKNHVEAAIVINSENDEFYKQPLFYALAHFSKFVPPGSKHIAYEISDDSVIECVAFLRPDEIVAIVLQNRNDTDVNVVVKVAHKKRIVIPVTAHSMHTVLYEPISNNYNEDS